MSMLVRCRWCGHEFEVGREPIVAGTWRRLCKRCRPLPPPHDRRDVRRLRPTLNNAIGTGDTTP